LVVIGIIALLISILLPSLSKARSHAQAVQCESGLRQIGMGLMMYADSHHGNLAIDGNGGSNNISYPTKKADLIGTTLTPPQAGQMNGFDDPGLWFNAAASSTGRKSYYDMVIDDAQGRGTLPNAETGKSIFVCPAGVAAAGSAAGGDTVENGYFKLWGVDRAVGATPYQFKSYMSYAFNSKLYTSTQTSWKMSQLLPSSTTVLVMERVMTPGEWLDPVVQAWAKNPVYSGTKVAATVTATGYNGFIAQPKACWSRFTARHNHGGFICFADGHVGWLAWTATQGTPSTATNNDWNQPSVCIWNPLLPTN
jgi:type II secretory pathway pseudopilin PulG